MDPLIWVKENVLTSEFCRSVIYKFEEDDRKNEGKLGFPAKVDLSKKQSTDLNISRLSNWKEEDIVFRDSLSTNLACFYDEVKERAKGVLAPNMGKNASLIDSGYQIQRTVPGGFYKWHADDNISPPYIRYLTYIWYLNDVQDGGYTEFSTGVKIQPEEGKLLIFPATWTYVHQGYPPRTETKYISTGWLSYRNYDHFPE